MNKDTEFVMCVDDFLSAQYLFLLQDELIEITEYESAVDPLKNIFGWRYHYNYFSFNEKHPDLLDDIKNFFFPNRDLVPMQISSNIRAQNSVAEDSKPLFHRDTYGDNVANFMLYVKGEPLINNGTGFLHDNKLSTHIGFVENRALFFNGLQLDHGDLQALGDSSIRYTLNIFYKEQR